MVAPIDAAVSANLLCDGSTAQALADQGVAVTQTVDADAIATGIQDSTIDQSDTYRRAGGPADGGGGDQAMLAAAHRGRRRRRQPRRAASEPVDGSVVVDSTGDIVGTLDRPPGTSSAPTATSSAR